MTSGGNRNIIFFGTENFSLSALTGLIEAGYNTRAVITKPDSRSGRGQKLVPTPVKVLASKHNIPVWQPVKLHEVAGDIKALSTVTGVLVSYGKIIPQSIIDMFTPGIINVHPSLLPKYRGPSPFEAAIKNGDSETGVSIMQLSADMDAGPVYAQKIVSLSGHETGPELTHALADVGTDLLLETLPQILDGSLQPTAQDDTQATYCELLQKSDAWLDVSMVTAAQAERIVRAHLEFPRTKFTIRGIDIIATKAHVASEQKTPLDLKCRDGAYLSIDELIAPSGRTMSSSAFLNGYAA